MRLSENVKSIIMDGLLLALVLTLLSLLLNLLIAPIESLTGTSGLLIYVVILLALSMYCLDRALATGYLDTRRAWSGAIGGVVGWVAISLNDQLGSNALININAIVWLIILGLTVSILWRRVLPIGARYFFITLILSWVARFCLLGQELLARWDAGFANTYRFSGYVALFGALVALTWLFLRTRQHTQRMWTGVWAWFFIIIALSVFFGRLI